MMYLIGLSGIGIIAISFWVYVLGGRPSDWGRATAVVLYHTPKRDEADGGHVYYVSTLKYTVPESGEEVVFPDRSIPPRVYPLGQAVPIFYNPRNPAEVAMVVERSLVGLTIWLLVGLMCFSLAVVMT